MASVEFHLRETYGNPPMHGGGYLIGAAGDTVVGLVEYLEGKFGTRLQRIRAQDGTERTYPPSESAPCRT